MGLFLSREIVSRRSLEVVADIHDQGGIAILPHPYAYHQDLTPELLQQLDGVEIYNGRDKRDYSAQTYADYVEPYGLATVANSAAPSLLGDRLCLHRTCSRPAGCFRRARGHPRPPRPTGAGGRTALDHGRFYGSKVVKRVKRLYERTVCCQHPGCLLATPLQQPAPPSGLGAGHGPSRRPSARAFVGRQVAPTSWPVLWTRACLARNATG